MVKAKSTMWGLPPLGKGIEQVSYALSGRWGGGFNQQDGLACLLTQESSQFTYSLTFLSQVAERGPIPQCFIMKELLTEMIT